MNGHRVLQLVGNLGNVLLGYGVRGFASALHTVVTFQEGFFFGPQLKRAGRLAGALSRWVGGSPGYRRTDAPRGSDFTPMPGSRLTSTFAVQNGVSRRLSSDVCRTTKPEASREGAPVTRYFLMLKRIPSLPCGVQEQGAVCVGGRENWPHPACLQISEASSMQTPVSNRNLKPR